MADDLIIGGLPEPEFRWEIEMYLRVGKADDAANRLKTLMEGFCGPGRPLPARFLTIGPEDVELDGWNNLPQAIEEYDKRGNNITAIGIDFSSPSHLGSFPDENGLLEPHIETNYYTDFVEWPFSTSDRTGLLGCYQSNISRWLGKPKWVGHFEELDDTISVKGIADLYGAVYRINRTNPTTDEQQARVLGACYVAVLVHLAVRDFAPRNVLPRPMAVIVGSNDDYPFFHAPAFAAR